MIVITLLKKLLSGSRPVLVVSALVAVLGITGSAYGARLITGGDIRDGSITAVDLAKGTQGTLHGDKGDKGGKGGKGDRGLKGSAGNAGVRGATGAFGATGAAGASVLGPQGPQGAQGPQGVQGTQGTAGAASTVAGPPGNPGTPGSPGAPGAPGPGTTQGSPCTTPGGTGTINWVDESAGAHTAYNLHCVNVTP
jgi:hypothetical protein